MSFQQTQDIPGRRVSWRAAKAFQELEAELFSGFLEVPTAALGNWEIQMIGRLCSFYGIPDAFRDRPTTVLISN